MGYDDDWDVVGDDIMGEESGYEVVGAAPGGIARAVRALRKPPQRLLAIPPRPQWRRELAPGVPAPAEGLEPLPLTPQANGGVFDSVTPAITWEARPQAPFRAERLLVSIRRSAGAALTQVLGQGIFIGRELQLLELGNFDLEFFSQTAFGVRLKLAQAQPGVLIRIPAITNVPVPAGEFVSATLMFLGRSIRS